MRSDPSRYGEPKQLVPRPTYRRLRGYAFDPSLSLQLETALVNEVVFKVPWENYLEVAPSTPLIDPKTLMDNPGEPSYVTKQLAAGPVGEYLEVIDFDPASGCFYAPIHLDTPYVLGQDGLAPSEGTPQFHQQMVYAVAMTTIGNFERALGRFALWAPEKPASREKPPGAQRPPRDKFVPRLRIFPHALREPNAYYSPQKRALLFGYFPAPERMENPAAGTAHFPGGWVFTCLSHDVVAHETTHALLDGMHQKFIESTHPDSLAFHEAFADIVALFQHFSFPEVLRHQIGKTRGDLATQNMLGQLAQQFGRAIGQHGALRDAIGELDQKTKKWRPHTPDPSALMRTFEPHDRGAILVAAVFDAFQAIYSGRVADLLRIATSGTGVLPDGELHPDLVNRLAAEATKSAKHVLQMCIRALDYCPPIEITFGDYLRAIITADSDLVPDDDLGYRVAFIEAFRRRGIYPRSVRTLSADNLRWPLAMQGQRDDVRIQDLTRVLKKHLGNFEEGRTREEYFKFSQDLAEMLHNLLTGVVSEEREFGERLEDFIEKRVRIVTTLDGVPTDKNGRPSFEVHSMRLAKRVGPDGDSVNHLVAIILQRRTLGKIDKYPELEGYGVRGGVTLIFNLETFELQYVIPKDIDDIKRFAAQRKYAEEGEFGDLWSTYFHRAMTACAEPFAMLHRDGEELEP
jgi:hypothetical protein